MFFVISLVPIVISEMNFRFMELVSLNTNSTVINLGERRKRNSKCFYREFQVALMCVFVFVLNVK